MADVHSKEVRSHNMRQIRSKGTKPELLIRKALYAAGFRYRLNDKNLPGKPDIVLKKYKLAIFVHGCFWHSHKACRYFTIPKTRTEWWVKKLKKNQENDKNAITELKRRGWRIKVIWECELKPAKIEKTTTKLLKNIK